MKHFEMVMHTRSLAFVLPVAMAVLAGCARPPQLVTVPTGEPTQCAQQEILPTITEVRPDEIHPGDEVTIVASGGYLRDTCGGYNESARDYKIYLDDEPVGDLSCYVHHCEGKFTLPPDASPGEHCLGVQQGSCQRELVVE